VSLPYGYIHRYDFPVESGKKLWRVQVKTTTFMVDGSDQVCIRRNTRMSTLAYTAACRHPEAAESLAKPRTPNEGSLHSAGSTRDEECSLVSSPSQLCHADRSRGALCLPMRGKELKGGPS
jgi:hypothetical protein